jgi:hypothetical protein
MKLVSLLVLCLCVLVAGTAAGQLTQTTTVGADGTTTTTIGNGTTSTPRTSVPGVSASPATSTTAPVVVNLVEITRMVPAGTTAVTAFTVPAEQTLILTDVVLTNTTDRPTCGAAINRAAGAATGGTTPTTTGGTATGTGTTTGTGMTTGTGTTTGTTVTGTATGGTGTTNGTTTVAPLGATTTLTTPTMPGTSVQTLAGTITESDSSITGPLCVAARTSTPLPFTTGIEFGPGQTVQLLNVPPATTTTTGAAATATTTAGAVGFHLRGMLVASSPV